MPEKFTTIIYQQDDRIARITLNRPDKLNAINDEMPREYRLLHEPLAKREAGDLQSARLRRRWRQ